MELKKTCNSQNVTFYVFTSLNYFFFLNSMLIIKDLTNLGSSLNIRFDVDILSYLFLQEFLMIDDFTVRPSNEI